MVRSTSLTNISINRTLLTLKIDITQNLCDFFGYPKPFILFNNYSFNLFQKTVSLCPLQFRKHLCSPKDACHTVQQGGKNFFFKSFRLLDHAKTCCATLLLW